VWDLSQNPPVLIKDGSTSYITGNYGLPLER